MSGISAIGIHIPRLRLPLSMINAPDRKSSVAEKAVAGFDEDAITMAVSAARDCLRNAAAGPVDALYMASTTSPFVEKSAAAIVAKALNHSENILTADFGGSLRSSANALRAAMDAVAAGSATRVLVVASDMRTAEPYSAQEQQLGDAAVALLVEGNGALRLESDAAINRQLYDVWREDGATTLRNWEDRFIVKHGYQEGVLAAMHALADQGGPAAESVRYLACYAPDPRSGRSLAHQLGFEPEQLVSSLFGRIGNCGVAMVPLMLAQAMQDMKSGDRLITVSYGDGAHAMSWRLEDSDQFSHGSLSAQLGAGIRMRSYRQYLQCRGLDVARAPVNPADGISATTSYREQDSDIAFLGVRCLECGTEQFPAARLCYRCHQRDNFEAVALASRSAQIASYTRDYFFPSPVPPVVAGMCEVEGGARVYVQMADYNDEELFTGMPVEFVFRRIHAAGGKPAYFWKSRLLQSVDYLEENTERPME